jgi:hypothetical protein
VWALLLTLPAVARADQQPAAEHPAAQSQSHDEAASKFTFGGDAALWTVAIKPDKTADFERVLAKLGEALRNSNKPEWKQQAEGWRVTRLDMPLPDGNVAYVHNVHPVVPNADYSVMRILYEAFPDQRQQLYELYRSAFVHNVSLATGTTVADLSKLGAAQAPPAAPPPSTSAPEAIPPATATPPQAPSTSTPSAGHTVASSPCARSRDQMPCRRD